MNQHWQEQLKEQVGIRQKAEGIRHTLVAQMNQHWQEQLKEQVSQKKVSRV